jgi:tetratricopeptide (TPR) repeat protein
MVVGDAGIGKSRLLDEFSAWLAELSEEPMLMKGRARQEIQGVPFGLWRDLIGAQFGIQEGDQAGAARSKLEAGIGAIRADPDPAPAHFIGGLLGFELPDSPHLAAVREDPQQLRDRGITYLLDYVKAVSSQSPAVLLLEDVHWADDSSLEVLYRMGLGLEGYPMIAVCAARPTLFERRLDWGSAPAFYRQVDLRPLSHQDCRQLVADVLRKVEQMPAGLLDRIVGSAEGNPFYIEELVKMLVEDGVVVKGEPTWQVREDRFSQVRVPDTLTGVLQSRLDSLPGGERIVLQQAATAGRVFWEDTIACLNPGKDGDLPGTGERVPGILASQVSDRLEGLVGREMIFHHPDSTFVATREFTFKHAILMEVAYESTLKRVRREYHALVANWLMEQEGDWHTGLHGWIAEHLERAGRGEHARGHLERAGDQAAAAYANEEAAQFYRRALALTPPDDLEARFRLLRSREKICALQGAQEERRQDLDEMAVLADTLGDEGRRAEVALLWARYNEERSAYPEAIEAAQRAIDLARPATSPAAVAAYNTWSRALWKQGALDQARQKAEAGLALAVQGGDRRGEGELQNTLGILAWEQGQLDLALSYYERCLQLAAESGDRRGEGAALNNLGAVSASREDYLQTQAYLERCLDIFREIGDQQVEGRVLGNLGLVAANLGDDDRAQVYYEQGLRISRMTGDLRSEGIKLSNLGWLAARRGDSAAAREHLDRSLALASQTGLIWLEAEALTGLGHALLVQGAVGEARAAYQKALALDRDLEQPHRGMEPLAGLARCELAAGDALGALAFVEEILAYLAEGGTLDGTEEPLRIYLTCFQVLREVKDRRAEELLEAAWRKMQQRAGRLQDEPARRRFLDNVPWHRALQAAWQKSRSAR